MTKYGIGDQILVQEEFQDTKGVIIIRKSKDRQHDAQKKNDTKSITKHYREN